MKFFYIPYFNLKNLINKNNKIENIKFKRNSLNIKEKR